MGTRDFEIEEEFDLCLLGLTSESPSALPYVSEPNVSEDIPPPGTSSKKLETSNPNPRTAPRRQNGRYVSADWTPEDRQTSKPVATVPTPQSPLVESHDFAEVPRVKERPSSPAVSATASTIATNDGYSTVELTDVEAPARGAAPSRRQPVAYLRKSRLPSGRLRPAIRLRTPLFNVSSHSPTPSPPPLPSSTFQRDVISQFSASTIDTLESLSKQHNTTGLHLPSNLRDFFPALTSNKSAIHLVNDLRTHLDLPLLSMQTDRVGLRRSIAVMRERLYLEIASALVLPSAPLPLENGAVGDTKSEKPDLSLTPSSLAIMSKALPKAFPHDAGSIKAFLKQPRAAYGDEKAKVVWERGVGRLAGGKHEDRSHDLEHPSGIHVFVDQPTPPGTLHLVASSPLHQDLDPLVRLGWDVSVLKRVEVYEDEILDPSALHLQSKPTNGLAMERHDTGIRRYREQAVDEILCLKVLQTLNKRGVVAPPGSKIVLATGDARGGQFNEDGFLGTVKEALKRGWHVELWSWSSGLSRAWAETAKREGWGKEFHIHYLDTWAPQLVEVLPDDEDD